MSEYKVELVKASITDLSVSVDFQDSSVTKINTSHSAEIYEPTDESDPTALIKAELEMSDPENEYLSVTCKAEFIVRFEPIPDNRSKVASDLCPAIINKEFARIMTSVLHDMGHELMLS